MSDIADTINLNASENKKVTNKYGLFALGCITSVAGSLVAITFPFLLPAFRKVCLPYVPASPTQITNILNGFPKKVKLKPLAVAEVGSGDGRVAIAIAKQGHQVVGLELNPWLVWYSRYQTIRNNISINRCVFKKTDLWKVNYSIFDRVVVFGVEEMMPDLEAKLKAEMKPGSQIIACRFHMPNLLPCKVIGEGIDSVWVYTV